MQRLRFSFLLLLALFGASHSAKSEEPSLTTGALLAKWEAASKELKSVDSEFTWLHYGDEFRKTERRSSGRFYWETSGRGFYKVDGQMLIVWEAGSLCYVDYKCKTFFRWSPTKVASARKRFDSLEQLSGWTYLRESFVLLPLHFADAESLLPLSTQIDAATIQKRFDVTWQEIDGAIFVTARPKEKRDADRFQQIDVQLDRNTFRVLAHRRIESRKSALYPDNPNKVVHIFKETTMNAVPADLDEAMHPSLEGFLDQTPPAEAVKRWINCFLNGP